MQACGRHFRGCVVAILSLAWLVAANHCAVASLAGGLFREEHSCCAKDEPVKAPTSCAEVCCDKMATPVKFAGPLFPPGLALVAILSEVVSLVPIPIDPVDSSGLSPPAQSHFVRCVLGCSQQALAPPVFVS